MYTMHSCHATTRIKSRTQSLSSSDWGTVSLPERRRVPPSMTLRKRSWQTNTYAQNTPTRHENGNDAQFLVPICWFTILKAQLRLSRINRQDQRYAILCQRLTEEVAKEASDVILGPLSVTPYDDLMDAIRRRSQPGEAGHMTLLLPQQSADLRISEPLHICNQPSRENTLAQKP